MTICVECGKEFDNTDTYSKDKCDDCFDEKFGYCDKCGKEFRYYNEMGKHNIPMCNVVCKECKEEAEISEVNKK